MSSLCRLETFANLHHLVSTIEGQLQPGGDVTGLIKAVFPGGSISGAPKLRAMEVIDQLEPAARGVFCGSLGWIGFDGALDFSILIRTLDLMPSVTHLWAGAGITLLSDPEAEYNEICLKAARIMAPPAGTGAGTMILVLNNRDSFVFNLARYFAVLGCEIQVVDSDRITVSEIERIAPEALVISPGPCTPSEAGISLEAIRVLGARMPILGACLGHQAIAAAHGWKNTRATSPAHGRAARIVHTGGRLFEGVPAAFEVGLYHSLIAEAPLREDELQIDAVSPAGEIMALSHREKPVYGVQFHPESILTEHGPAILKNFLNIARDWRQACSALPSP